MREQCCISPFWTITCKMSNNSRRKIWDFDTLRSKQLSQYLKSNKIFRLNRDILGWTFRIKGSFIQKVDILPPSWIIIPYINCFWVFISNAKTTFALHHGIKINRNGYFHQNWLLIAGKPYFNQRVMKYIYNKGQKTCNS